MNLLSESKVQIEADKSELLFTSMEASDELLSEIQKFEENKKVLRKFGIVVEIESPTETALPAENNIPKEVQTQMKTEANMEEIAIEPKINETIILESNDNILTETKESRKNINSEMENIDSAINMYMLTKTLDTLVPEKASTGDTSMLIETEQLKINEAQEREINLQDFLYNWEVKPKLLCAALKEYKPKSNLDNFVKDCFWSPDGTCLSSSSEDFRIRLYELPKNFYNAKSIHDSESTPHNEFVSDSTLTPALTVKEGGTVYDTCWFPFMNSWQPETCCFLSTSKESPIHLWDAYCGILRATYRSYNQVDEVEAALSIQFVNLASEIWCGLKNCVKTFNVERPGRHINAINFNTDFPNMRGLVSCIRENPAMPGLTAFGTYSKRIGLYKDKPLCVFEVGSGVTQIEFSPCGTKMFTAVRRSEEFLCWDLRNPGTIFCSLRGRKADTNQRIHFSVTPTGHQVVSGGTDGYITIWDLLRTNGESKDINPCHKVQLSTDCVNGVSLHKNLPLVAVSTGQRLCEDEVQKRDNGVRFWWMYQ